MNEIFRFGNKTMTEFQREALFGAWEQNPCAKLTTVSKEAKNRIIYSIAEDM